MNNRAVSPVIGVILMVAVTVILSGTIAMFVMDMGETATQNNQPNVAFDYVNNSDGTLTVRHTAGATLAADAVTVKAGGTETTTQFQDFIEAGDSITINVTSGETVVIIYTKGDQSTILSEHEAA